MNAARPAAAAGRLKKKGGGRRGARPRQCGRGPVRASSRTYERACDACRGTDRSGVVPPPALSLESDVLFAEGTGAATVVPRTLAYGASKEWRSQQRGAVLQNDGVGISIGRCTFAYVWGLNVSG